MAAAVLKDDVQKERPPIVVVMGHVDHGKTTLLDTVRRQKAEHGKRAKATTEGESGGITQHIGAYEVVHAPHTPRTDADSTRTHAEEGRRITFIDTPGHEAFSAMRSRGTDVADIALVVIAADDGVKPQTREVLKYITKAELPFVVALNKTDLPASDPERVKNQLAEEGVLVEERGGKVPAVPISAKSGAGIDELLDMILLVAELEELTYRPAANAEGYVIESHLDSRRGVVTSMVVTNGTLRVGDLVVCGPVYGRIKAMEDEHGVSIKGAVPSMPVQIVGMGEFAVSGDPCHRVELEEEAREEIDRHEQLVAKRKAELTIKPEGQEKVLPVIVKADVQGSLEAVVGTLRSIASERVGLNIVRCEVGDVSEDDIKFAEATGAAVFGFHTGTKKEARVRAEQKKVHIHTHEVIYELVEAVREEMSRLLTPEVRREELGAIEVVAIFRKEPGRMIVGGKVVSGKLTQGVRVEVVRPAAGESGQGEEVLGAGKVVSLKIGENEKKEVKAPDEAGVLYEGPVRIKEGDILRAFLDKKTHPTL